jgi:hypothetical protein
MLKKKYMSRDLKTGVFGVYSGFLSEKPLPRNPCRAWAASHCRGIRGFISTAENYFKNEHPCRLDQSGAPEKFSQRPKKTIKTPKTPFSLSIAAIPAESIPFIGVAALIADTGYELYAACETVRDLDQLYLDLGMEDEVPDDVIHSVCDPELPEAGEVWDGVVEKSGKWLDQARAAI